MPTIISENGVIKEVENNEPPAIFNLINKKFLKFREATSLTANEIFDD
jgi:hypothetical protein